MSVKPGRRIIHLDLDAFYASVEVLDNPALRGKPVIVGGGMKRGVVAAASYEARKFGVHSALPMARAARLCPHGVFLPGRMERYKEVSDRIFEIFRRFTPLVEPLSLDEAFLDVTENERLFGAAEEIARKIRAAVRAETGLTVSAGVASSKSVAKIASDQNKPDGLTIVPPGKEREFLRPLPAWRLWGVGKVTGAKLEEMGVRTVCELERLPAETLVAAFGRLGMHLHLLAQGIDDREVETEREAKSMGREDTFDEDLVSPDAVQRELLAISTRVAARLRRHGMKGKTVCLKVKYADFRLVTRETTLTCATDDGGEIYRHALSLLGKTDAGNRPVRLLGIYLSHFGEEKAADTGPRQMPLFGARPEPRHAPARQAPARDPARSARLNAAVDRIHEKYGNGAIGPGTLIGKDDE